MAGVGLTVCVFFSSFPFQLLIKMSVAKATTCTIVLEMMVS